MKKTMLIWDTNPPKWRFAESLPFFKLVAALGGTATLNVLANNYAPWLLRIHHDGLSDATAMMHVVTKSVPELSDRRLGVQQLERGLHHRRRPQHL